MASIGDPQAPKTEDEIRAVTVGELVPHNATITLAEYDPQWPIDFEQEARNVRNALGDRALGIEHVGSTSVPGLVAKPIVDMVLLVANSADEQNYVPDMEAAGYRLGIREPDWYEHRKFKGPRVNINLHVFSAGCPEVTRMLRFRDCLREHDDDRERYEAAKRELARREWKYVQNYADAKTAVIEAILTRATAPHDSSPERAR